MEDLSLFVINTEQVFLALLLLIFMSSFLFQDLNDMKDTLSKKKMNLLFVLFPVMSIGIFANLFNSWGFEGLFFAIEFSILIVLAIINPKYAVGFFVYLLLSRPWETFDDQLMQSMPRDISILTMMSIAAHKIIKKDFFVRFNMGTFFLLAFSFWLFLSAFFSAHQSTAISKYVEIFSKGVIVFLLIQNGLRKPADAFVIKAALIISILEKSFISFYQSAMTPKTGLEEAGERLKSIGILENSNDIAAIFVLVTPLVIFFILKSKIKPFSWIIALATLIMFSFLVWESQSRGAVLALFGGLGSYFFLKIKKTKYIAIILLLSMLGGVGVISLMKRSSSDLKGSTSNRIIFWQAGANMAIRNPVFGVGFWGFNRNFPNYAIGGDLGTEGKHMTAHSSWVVALSESGFLGLFFFMALWAYGLVQAWKVKISNPEYFMTIVGYGIAVSFLSHTYLLFPYILLSLVITHSKLEQGVKKGEVLSL